MGFRINTRACVLTNDDPVNCIESFANRIYFEPRTLCYQLTLTLTLQYWHYISFGPAVYIGLKTSARQRHKF